MTAFPQVMAAHGVLLEPTAPVSISAQILASERHDLGVRGWTGLTARSGEPWMPRDEAIDGAFEYHFILRKSRRRLMLLGSHALLATELLRRSGLEPFVRVPLVDVPAIVNQCIRGNSEYRMGAVYARVDAYGVSLRTMAFYGDDLGDAEMFRRLTPEVSPYRVRLRHYRTGADSITVDSRGSVGIHYRGRHSLTEADKAMKYLSDMTAIRWESND